MSNNGQHDSGMVKPANRNKQPAAVAAAGAGAVAVAVAGAAAGAVAGAVAGAAAAAGAAAGAVAVAAAGAAAGAAAAAVEVAVATSNQSQRSEDPALRDNPQPAKLFLSLSPKQLPYGNNGQVRCHTIYIKE